MPLFLVDFGAWLSQPSADFAREVSAESAENKGFRARSDYSLLPSRKRVELKCLTTIIFSVFRRVKSRKVVLDIDSPRQNPQKNYSP